LATIKKKDLAATIAASTGCKKELAYQVVGCVFEAMKDQLIEGNRIEIRGFGVFGVKMAKSKPNSRNPRTGEKVYVPARGKSYFRPGQKLKAGMMLKNEQNIWNRIRSHWDD